MGRLTTKQLAFVDAYAQSGDVLHAAKLAGYTSVKSRADAEKLLEKKGIAEALKEAENQVLEEFKRKILEEIASIAFARMNDFAEVTGGRLKIKDSSEITPEALAAVAGMREGTKGIELKLYDKQRALELLCKAHGVLEPKEDTSGSKVLIIDDL